MMGRVKMMTRHRRAWGDSFELIVDWDLVAAVHDARALFGARRAVVSARLLAAT